MRTATRLGLLVGLAALVLPGPPGWDAPPEGPALVFDPPVVDLGVVPLGRPLPVEIAWRRVGVDDLRVLLLKTEGGSEVAAGLPGRIPPGAAGSVRLTLAARTSRGAFATEVRAVLASGGAARATVRGFAASTAPK